MAVTGLSHPSFTPVSATACEVAPPSDQLSVLAPSAVSVMSASSSDRVGQKPGLGGEWVAKESKEVRPPEYLGDIHPLQPAAKMPEF